MTFSTEDVEILKSSKLKSWPKNSLHNCDPPNSIIKHFSSIREFSMEKLKSMTKMAEF